MRRLGDLSAARGAGAGGGSGHHRAPSPPICGRGACGIVISVGVETEGGSEMASSGVDGLSGVVRGRVVEQGSPGYDEARALYNAMIDKHPAGVVYCLDERDVAAAIRFARERGLRLAIRSGGHNGGGLGSVDEGLVLDLSPMNAVTVDAEASTVQVQGGAKLGEVDAATAAHGLVVPAGVVSTTTADRDDRWVRRTRPPPRLILSREARERRSVMGRFRRARRRRRRMARRRIALVGGMVAVGAKKMSEAQAKQIEEHTGVPPEELEDDDLSEAMQELGIPDVEADPSELS